LVLAACVAGSLAAPQGFYGLTAHPNGAVVPLDEPAVAAAKADHLATKFGHLAGHAVAAVPSHPVAAPAAAYAAVPAAAVPAAAVPAAAPVVATGYAGPIHVPTLVAHPNGAVVPADEPAVAAARADHLAAHGVAAPAAVAAYHAAAPVAAYAPALVAHPNGAVVPADEPAVVAARADHLAAHGVVAPYAAAAPVYAAAYHAAAPVAYAAGPALVAHPNGAVVPVDEPAVAAARADHLAAKAAIGH